MRWLVGPVEVTSPSSEEYDRSEKRDHYLTIPSLRAYVVVSHRELLFTAYVRETADEAWASREARVHEGLTLPGKTGDLDVDTVYRGVSL